jgi:hypothetical protein
LANAGMDTSAIDVYALLKFSPNERFLDDLVGGTIYANTPEFYRLHDAPGVSDHHESVAFTFREKRKDPTPKLVVGDRELTDLTALTVRFDGGKDAWLHSWTAVTLPRDEISLRSLVQDLRRVQAECGPHYVVVPAVKINELMKRIAALTASKVAMRAVAYSDEMKDSSPVCKRKSFEYQREVRFLIGECGDHDVTPLILKDAAGFGDLMAKNVDVSMINRENGQHMFDLRGSNPITCMLD